MGDIGTTLRDERIRLGIGIDAVEADTKIRAKYLIALEEERYESLPGAAYVRAFLRDYAERLGLDGQLLVDRLNAEAGLGDDVVAAPSRPARAGPTRRRPPRFVPLVAVVVLAVAAAGAWTLLGSSHPRASGAPRPPGHASPPPPSRGHHPAGPAVRLAATAGPTWLVVRRGGARGRVLYRGILRPGAPVTFRRRPLWLRVGAPRNLRVTVAGRRLRVPISTAGDLVVRRRSLRRVG